MDRKLKAVLLGLYGLIVVGFAVFVFDWIGVGKYGKPDNTEFSGGIKEIIDTTGATVEYSTGDIQIETGLDLIIPENPREYLEYIMDVGEGGIDYIVATPTNQPKMNSKLGEENTKEMRSYISKNKIKFEFDNNSEKEGYIMFVTTVPVPKAYKIFLGINGKTVGRLDKDARLESYEDNEYLYKLNEVKYFREGNKYKNADFSRSPIYINAVPSGGGNKLEKIIIFFK